MKKQKQQIKKVIETRSDIDSLDNKTEKKDNEVPMRKESEENPNSIVDSDKLHLLSVSCENIGEAEALYFTNLLYKEYGFDDVDCRAMLYSLRAKKKVKANELETEIKLLQELAETEGFEIDISDYDK